MLIQTFFPLRKKDYLRMLYNLASWAMCIVKNGHSLSSIEKSAIKWMLGQMKLYHWILEIFPDFNLKWLCFFFFLDNWHPEHVSTCYCRCGDKHCFNRAVLRIHQHTHRGNCFTSFFLMPTRGILPLGIHRLYNTERPFCFSYFFFIVLPLLFNSFLSP